MGPPNELDPCDPQREPVSALIALGAAMTEGRPPPRHLAEWFAIAIARWLDKGGALDQALGLAGAKGIDCALTRYRRSRRNAFIRRAYKQIECGSPWKRCQQLEHEIAVFIARLWPAWRQLNDPPAGASKLRSALFHAAKCGELPATARQLHDICTSVLN